MKAKEEILAAAGISPARLGVVETIEWPHPKVAQGDAGEVARAVARPGIAKRLRVELDVALGDRGLRVRSTVGEELICRFEGVDRLVEQVAAEVDLGPVPWAIVQRRRGDGLLLECDASSFRITELRAFVPEQPPTIGEPPPAESWARAAEDEWLLGHVRGRLEAGDTWNLFAAAAAVAWLCESRSVESVPLPWVAGPRRWARALPEPLLEHVERLALTEVDAIRLTIEDLDRSWDPQDSGWGKEWLRVCHLRDDLEGVALLLRETGRRTLDEALNTLDEIATPFRDEAPSLPLGPRGEQLDRAASHEPDGWWVHPTLEDWPN